MKTFNPKRKSQERMNFVEYWAEYVKTHDDRDWSRQQKIVVDSQIKNLIGRKK